MALLSVFVALSFAACEKKTPPVAEVSLSEAQGLLRNDFAVLLDAREREQVSATGMASGAVNLPKSEALSGSSDWQRFVDGAKGDKQVLVYAASSEDAREVARRLAEEGIRTGVIGTFEQWQAAGLPVAEQP